MDNRFANRMVKSKGMNVYFISGLGADKRAFERLRLPGKFHLHYLDWIEPLKNETLDSYAKRLAAGIEISQPFAIVGLSMGGMIATAMTKFVQPVKTILISSIGCKKEMSPFLKIVRFSRIYKLLPLSLLHAPNPLVYWMFGARTKNEKRLLHHIILSSEPRFIKWGISAIVNWNNAAKPENVFHIHGSLDKILPVKYTKPNVIIKNGSHFMVWTKAGEVSKHLIQVLESKED